MAAPSPSPFPSSSPASANFGSFGQTSGLVGNAPTLGPAKAGSNTLFGSSAPTNSQKFGTSFSSVAGAGVGTGAFGANFGSFNSSQQSSPGFGTTPGFGGSGFGSPSTNAS